MNQKTGHAMGRSTLDTRMELVTPEMARRWLSRNARNRRLDAHIVRKYADDMRSGIWATTHQGIAFYANGDLADGQHRLSAIVEAETPVLLHVTYGIPQSSIVAIDSGKSRSVSDGLRFAEGAPAWLMNREAAAMASMLLRGFDHSRRASAALVVEYAVRYERLLRPIADIMACHTKMRRGGLVGACVACAIHANHPGAESAAERFFYVMHEGVADASESAAIRLRDLFATERFKLHQRIAPRYTQRAFEAFIAGEPIKLLRPAKALIWPCPPFGLNEQAAKEVA